MEEHESCIPEREDGAGKKRELCQVCNREEKYILAHFFFEKHLYLHLVLFVAFVVNSQMQMLCLSLSFSFLCLFVCLSLLMVPQVQMLWLMNMEIPPISPNYRLNVALLWLTLCGPQSPSRLKPLLLALFILTLRNDRFVPMVV
jgi:hypothetical protein